MHETAQLELTYHQWTSGLAAEEGSPYAVVTCKI